jgi:DegV family protein with EDD domain
VVFILSEHQSGGIVFWRENVPEIAIVTDSLASLPPDVVKKYDIKVAPQVVNFGEETLLDGIDITPTEFFKRLATTQIMPSTSQATLASFIEIFEPLVAENRPVLAIVGSSKLTATMNSAEQAKAMFPDATIEIIDSLDVAMSMGFQVITAAKAVHEGASLEEAAAIARTAHEHTGVLFVVDTLEFLHRGGRIGGASRFFGTALNLKPLLELQDGRVEAVERIRTTKKAHARLVDKIEERLQGKMKIRLAGLHGAAEKGAKKLLEDAVSRINPDETYFGEITPVIGTHTGPGVVGIAYSEGL